MKNLTKLFVIFFILPLFLLGALVLAPQAKAAQFTCEEPPECATLNFWESPKIFLSSSFALRQICHCPDFSP